MAEAVVALLAAAPAGVLVDGTLGGGGHSAALIEATGRFVIGVDQDQDAHEEASKRLASSKDEGRFQSLHGNFRDLPRLLDDKSLRAKGGVAGILLDLGVSSHQLDEAERGFAFRFPEAPLDMRMNATAERPNAAELLESVDQRELTHILRSYGEVQRADKLARAIKGAQDAGRMQTTGDLTRVVEETLPQRRAKKGAHPATTVFQALRIAVNQELDALDEALSAAESLLVPGGRLVVISYHSLEDRRVKQCFRLGERGPARPGHLPPPSDWQASWKILTSKALKASEAEIASNPRARSARLRAAARAPRRGELA